MVNDWIDVSLAEVSDRIGDGLHGTPTYCEHGDYPFINGNNLENGSIVVKDATKRVSQDEYLKHKKELTNNTVLVSINGTIGNVALYDGEEVVLGKSACYINLKEGISKHFIRYVMSGYLFQEYIQRCSTGSTIKNVSLKMMRDFRFKIPKTEAEQLEVIQSVKYLDNKITLNRQINQTLEQMAQALFKSWFVDFDPVVDNALDAGFFEQDLAFPDELLRRAEARRAVREHGDFKPLPDAIRQLFPAAFEECAEPSLGLGGWVPQGWNVAVSGEHIDVRDGTHDSPKKSEHGFPLVTSKNLTSGRLNLTSAYLITPKDYNEVNKRSKVNHGDILLTMIGTLGIPCLVSTKDVNFAIKNIGLFKTSETPHLKSYFFELLKSQGMQQFLDSRAAGTTQKYLSLKVLRTINFVLPCSEVLSGFNKLIQSYENKIQINDDQNSVLANLRDALLPKLISGKLCLDNIEADFVKEGVA
ncbi:restriction endonuclease subunit S [Aeromonas hydrophila]|uniref:restriction endonuclease subunit S n=1 Tax=Aeromonas hydrophila TaxID=644 RepID=UPI003F790217|nr:restriction endonuclease subunit S [Aeromonas hydrophila]